MKQRIILCTVLCINLFMIGCYRPVDIVEALPIAKPKNLTGTISKNTYTSINNKFSVNLPYESNSSKWKYMNAKDGNHGNDVTFVDFGPVIGPSVGRPIFDDNIYSVVYVKHPENWDTSTFYDWSDKVFNKYTDGKGKVLFIDKSHINGNRSVYAVYSTEYNNKPSIVFYLIEHEGYAANLIARLGKHHSGVNEEILISRQWDRFNHMASSFKVVKSNNHD